jgi:predicted HTH transcriptional regulator
VRNDKKRVNVYLTDEMYDVLKSASKDNHLTMSAYMNMCLVEFLKLNDEEYLRDLANWLDMQMDTVTKRIEYIKKAKK